LRLNPHIFNPQYLEQVSEKYASTLVSSVLDAVRVLSFVHSDEVADEFFETLRTKVNPHPVSMIQAIQEETRKLIERAGYKPGEISFEDILIEPIHVGRAKSFLQELVEGGIDVIGRAEIERGVSIQRLREYDSQLRRLLDDFKDLQQKSWDYATYKRLKAARSLAPEDFNRLKKLEDELTRTGLLARFQQLEGRFQALTQQFSDVEALVGTDVANRNIIESIRLRLNRARGVYKSTSSVLREAYKTAAQEFEDEMKTHFLSMTNAYSKEEVAYLEKIGLLSSNRTPQGPGRDAVAAEIAQVQAQTDETVEALKFGKKLQLGGGGTELVRARAAYLAEGQQVESLYREVPAAKLAERRTRWLEARDLDQKVMIAGSAVPFRITSIDEEQGVVTLAAQKLPAETRIVVEIEPGAVEAIQTREQREAMARFFAKEVKGAYRNIEWGGGVSEVFGATAPGRVSVVNTAEIIRSLAAAEAEKAVAQLTDEDVNAYLLKTALSVAPWAKGKYEDVDIVSSSWLALNRAISRASIAGKIDAYNPAGVARNAVFRKTYRRALLGELFATDLRAASDEYSAIATIGSKLKGLTVIEGGRVRELTDLEKAKLIHDAVVSLVREAGDSDVTSGIEHLQYIADMKPAEIARYLKQRPVEEESLVTLAEGSSTGRLAGRDVTLDTNRVEGIVEDVADEVVDSGLVYELELPEEAGESAAQAAQETMDITQPVRYEIDLSGVPERERQERISTLFDLSEKSGGKVKLKTYVKQSNVWHPVTLERGTGGDIIASDVLTGEHYLVSGMDELTAGLLDEFEVFKPTQGIPNLTPPGYERLTRGGGIVLERATPPSGGVTVDETLGTLTRLKANVSRRPYTVAVITPVQAAEGAATTGLNVQLVRYSRGDDGRIISELVGAPEVINLAVPEAAAAPDEVLDDTIANLRRIKQSVDYVAGPDLGKTYAEAVGMVRTSAPEAAPRFERTLTSLFRKPKIDTYTVRSVFDLPAKSDALTVLDAGISTALPAEADIRPLRKGDLLYRHTVPDRVIGNLTPIAGDTATKGIYRFRGIEERDGVLYALAERLDLDEAGRWRGTGIIDEVAAESFTDLAKRFHSQFAYVPSAEEAKNIFMDDVLDLTAREVRGIKTSLPQLSRLVAYTGQGAAGPEAFQPIIDKTLEAAHKLDSGAQLTPGEQLLVSMLGSTGSRDISKKTVDQMRYYLTRDVSPMYKHMLPHMQEWLASPEGQAFKTLAEDIVMLHGAGVLKGDPGQLYSQIGEKFKRGFIKGETGKKLGLEVSRYTPYRLYKFTGLPVGKGEIHIPTVVPEELYSRLREYVERSAKTPEGRKKAVYSLIDYFRQCGIADENVRTLDGLAQSIYNAAQRGALDEFAASLEAAHIPAIRDEQTASRFIDWVYDSFIIPAEAKKQGVQGRAQFMEWLRQRPVISARLDALERGIQELKDAGIDIAALPAIGEAADVLTNVPTEDVSIPPLSANPAEDMANIQQIIDEFQQLRDAYNANAVPLTKSDLELFEMGDALEQLRSRLQKELRADRRPTWAMLGSGADMRIPLTGNVPGVGDIFFKRIGDFTPEQLEQIALYYTRAGADTVEGHVRDAIVRHLKPDVDVSTAVKSGIDPLTGTHVPLQSSIPVQVVRHEPPELPLQEKLWRRIHTLFEDLTTPDKMLVETQDPESFLVRFRNLRQQLGERLGGLKQLIELEQTPQFQEQLFDLLREFKEKRVPGRPIQDLSQLQPRRFEQKRVFRRPTLDFSELQAQLYEMLKDPELRQEISYSLRVRDDRGLADFVKDSGLRQKVQSGSSKGFADFEERLYSLFRPLEQQVQGAADAVTEAAAAAVQQAADVVDTATTAAVARQAADVIDTAAANAAAAQQAARSATQQAAEDIAQRAAEAASAAPGAEEVRRINQAIKAQAAAAGGKQGPGAQHIKQINNFIKAKAAAKSASGAAGAGGGAGGLLGSAIGNWKVLAGIGLASLGLMALLRPRDKDDYTEPESSGGRYARAQKPIPVAPAMSEGEQGEVYQRPVPVENTGARITIRGRTKRRLSANDINAIASEAFNGNVNVNVNFSNDTSQLNEDYAKEVFSQLLKYGYARV
jgi:hypothetical protein